MISRLVELLETIDQRLENIETVLPDLVDRVNTMSEVIASPDGYVTFSGVVKTPVEELKKAMVNSSVMQLSEVVLEAKFSQAVYLGARLDNNPDLIETLSEAAIDQMRNTVELANRLEHLTDKCQSELLDVGVAKAEAEKNLDINIGRLFQDRVNEVNKELDKKVVETERNNEKLERALERLESQCKKAEALNARLSNEVTVKSTPSKFVSRRKS